VKPEIVAGSALWPNGQPPEINKLWQEMKRDLRAAGDDWDVWTDWYEARLAGKRSSKKLEIARALIPDETWGQGPAVVNAEIKRLIENHTPPRPKKDTKTPPRHKLRRNSPHRSKMFYRRFRLDGLPRVRSLSSRARGIWRCIHTEAENEITQTAEIRAVRWQATLLVRCETEGTTHDANTANH